MALKELMTENNILFEQFYSYLCLTEAIFTIMYFTIIIININIDDHLVDLTLQGGDADHAVSIEALLVSVCLSVRLPQWLWGCLCPGLMWGGDGDLGEGQDEEGFLRVGGDRVRQEGGC